MGKYIKVYIIVTFILWGLSSIILIANPKNRTIRWISLLGYTVGMGTFGVFLRKLLHYTAIYNINIINANKTISILAAACLTVSYHFAPYITVICSLYLSSLSQDKSMKRELVYKLSFLIPPAISLILYPFLFPFKYTQRLFLICWILPYFIYANYKVAKSYMKERIPAAKQQKFLIYLLLLIFTTYSFLACHLFPLLNISWTWMTDFLAVLLLLIILVFASVRYGMLGVKIKLEKYDPFKYLIALSTGTSIINHTLKNEVHKITLCAQNIKASCDKSDALISRNADTILGSAEYILNMVQKVKEHLNDIHLEENTLNLGVIIEKSLEMLSPYIEKYGITIKKHFFPDVLVRVDPIHMEEVLINILKNSIEALESDGTILIQTFTEKKHLTVKISDNGPGIDKETISKLPEPFFTTKNKGCNLGLGLSYCSNVMQKHGGLMEIKSEKGKGTSVLLKLPLYRIVKKPQNKTPAFPWRNMLGQH